MNLLEVLDPFNRYWLHDLPCSKCGRNLSVKMQQEEIY
jgi:hypothetical protein